MNILVLGNSKDAHARHLRDALTQAGAVADYLDTRLFPICIQVSWQPNTQVGYLTLPGGRKLKFQDIHSVFWRHISAPYIPDVKDSASPDVGDNEAMIVFNEAMSVLRTLTQAGPTVWINSWQAYQFHKEKPLQLRKVKLQGVEIPATLISNDPKQVIEFCQSQSQTIFKPVYGGTHTQLVTDFHLDPERLRLALRLSPVTIQEYMTGTNIRSYVIGNCVYSAEIRSNSIDFRADENAELIPVELPESVRQQCLAITQALMLKWTAIDWRINPPGKYVFLEANPSPMFRHFEHQTGLTITQQLVKLLIR